jgi:hypothetical protein
MISRIPNPMKVLPNRPVQGLKSRALKAVDRKKRSLRFLASSWLCLPILLATGCSSDPPSGTVTGKVIFNGQPYDDAAVMMIDKTTGQAVGTDINSGGEFAIERPVLVGTYSVYLAPKSVPLSEAAPEAVKVDESVPQKYWSESTTDIEKKVVEGENMLTIELSKS